MSVITYVATRSIASDHELNGEYTIAVPMSAIDTADKYVKKEHTALGGATETWLNRIEETLSFQTAPIAESNPLCGHLKELLRSTAAGESVIIDPWGSLGDPDNPQIYQLTLKKSAPSREGRIHYVRFTLTAKWVGEAWV